jgi:hypothetical protein
MSDIRNSFRKLDDILFNMVYDLLLDMVEYSFTLGDWGEYVWVVIDLRDDSPYLRNTSYKAKSFVINPQKIYEVEHQNVCNSCFENIYFSEYDYTTDSYVIDFNPGISELQENYIKMKNTIIKIENLAIDILNRVVNSYLDPSKEYGKISVYFRRREVPNDYKIIGEIEESTILGQPIPAKPEFYESINQYYEKIEKSKKNAFEQSISNKPEFIYIPVFEYMALKEKKKDTNEDEIELSYPDYYLFSLMIYQSSKIF